MTGFRNLGKRHAAGLQTDTIFENFANASPQFPSTPLLRKKVFGNAHLPCAKIRIFRKCRKLFAEKSHLRRMNEWPKMAKNAKAHKMSHLAKTHFSQMFWGCISKPMNNRLSWWDDYRLTAANVRRSIRPVFPMRPCNSRCKDTNKRAKNK